MEASGKETLSNITGEKLLDLCTHPLSCIKQVAWKSIVEPSKSEMTNSWGGTLPVLAFCFEDDAETHLLVAASDTSLLLRLTQGENYDAILDLTKAIDVENDCDPEKLVGMFDLDSVVCPVPEWVNLMITKASVITTSKDSTTIGFCFWINLGIRIGAFVAPLPGVTLSFNDTCDLIIEKAYAAERDGLVHILTKKFVNKKTPQQIHTIDWFNWLRPQL